MATRARLAHTNRMGPDMADVFPFWREVERTHQVQVRMTIVSGLGRFQGVLEVTFSVHPLEGYLQPNKDWPKFFGWSWPTADGLTWESFLYQKLHKVDWELSHSYSQRELLLFPAGQP